MRPFASQGQHRAFVLALKLAELEVIREAIGIYPIFLLDDVSSELDARRNAHLMRTLEGAGGQVFITTTDVAYLRLDPLAMRRFGVRDGRVAAV
jgi:DNA replication and repair protein RecF